MVNFEWYRSFIAVYRAGTVTGAAAARCLTQPAISQHLAALESAVGHALFQRTPRKMIATQQGQALYSSMAPAMDSLEKVSSSLRDTSTSEIPILRLGTPLDYFYEVGLQKLEGSSFRLHIELGDADALIERLSHGKLDAVIATQQILSANIDYTQIDQEAFCLVASPEIRLPDPLKQKLASPAAIEDFLQKQHWISYSAELPIIRRFWHVAFQRRPDIDLVMVVPSLLLIRKAVELGVGVSVLPRYICQQALDTGKLHRLWQPKGSLSNHLWLATRKVDRNKASIAQLSLLLRQHSGAD